MTDLAERPEVGVEAPPSGGGQARIISMAVGGVLVAMVALLAFAGRGEESGVHPLLGERAPAVVGTAIGGGEFDLDDHRGSWVLVNFFATWCPGCVNEHPDLVELEAWGQDNGRLQLVSVVFNDPVERVEDFFAQQGGTWPVVNTPSVPVQYRVAQIPETFVVSPGGQVVFHIEGEVRAAEIVALIEEADG